MIHITLGDYGPAHPDDGLKRSHVGYRPGMTADEMYEANHGEWTVGARAQKERYVLFSYKGIVVQAVEVETLDKTRPFPKEDKRDHKFTFNGRVLAKGDPVFDAYVGHDTPVTPARNPVRYFKDDRFDGGPGKPCRCGCSGTTTRGDFLPGHDQIAIHARIARIGTVSEFLDWFDALEGHQTEF